MEDYGKALDGCSLIFHLLLQYFLPVSVQWSALHLSEAVCHEHMETRVHD